MTFTSEPRSELQPLTSLNILERARAAQRASTSRTLDDIFFDLIAVTAPTDSHTRHYSETERYCSLIREAAVQLQDLGLDTYAADNAYRTRLVQIVALTTRDLREATSEV
jgi:hypothetical protein